MKRILNSAKRWVSIMSNLEKHVADEIQKRHTVDDFLNTPATPKESGMPQNDEEAIYVPCDDEPSVFDEKNNAVSIEWLSWYRHLSIYGRNPRTPVVFEIKAPSYEIMSVGLYLKDRLRKQLKNPNITLPDRPPAMATKGQGFISLAWVMDTARREGIPPEEAVTLGIALRKMQ